MRGCQSPTLGFLAWEEPFVVAILVVLFSFCGLSSTFRGAFQLSEGVVEKGRVGDCRWNIGEESRV